MDILNIVLTPEGFISIPVAAVVCVLVTQWLKSYLAEWRFTNLIALGLTLVVEAAALLATGKGAEPAIWFSALWAGFVGACLATYGYETLTNLIGLAGVGPRK